MRRSSGLWRIRSIQGNISFAFVILILLTIFVMSSVSYYVSEEAVQRNAEAYTTELIKQVNQNIRSYINGMAYISDLVATNRTIREYLSKSSFSSLEEEKRYKENIYEFLRSMSISRKDIVSVSIFGNNGQFVAGNRVLELNPYVELSRLSWYTKAKEQKGKNVISSSHVQPVFKDRFQWVVSLSRELQNDMKNEDLGVFLVDLNYSVINDMFKNIKLGQRGYMFIVDDAGNVVYHPQQQLVYSNLKHEMIEKVIHIGDGSFMTDEGADSRIYTVQDSGFGWKTVGVSYVNELVGNKTNVRLSFIMLGAVSVVIAIVISVYLSNRLIKPIKQLQHYMKEVEKGNFDIHVPIPFTIEVGRLARAFNIMVSKIKELMNQVVRDEELKRRSELKALQAQINPHFLYNTLDSIIWMAESKKSEEVVIMTSSLAKLLRASISKGEELVTIQTEIDHITNYLMIQKMRYKHKLDYTIEVSDSILGYRMVKVILQPLVENAIYHGIKKKRGSGCIRITSEETEQDIILLVEDNGIGMDADQVRSLFEQDRTYEAGRGVGIQNVHQRLMLHYGNDYGLRYSSVPGEGTIVMVRIPKHQKPQEDDQ